MRIIETTVEHSRMMDCVPNLELNGFVVDGDHASAGLNADGEVMHRLEPLVCELQQQA
jgi:hypothetical protein